MSSGRTFAIVPRSYAPRGYVDLDMDDLKPGTISFELQEHVHAALRRSTVSRASICRDQVIVML